MRSVVRLLLLLPVLVTEVVAQPMPQRLAERDQRIRALYAEEAYPEMIRAIDAQVQEAGGTPWEDSVYRYCYEYGRAQWKATGAEKGLVALEGFYDRVRRLDDHPEHAIEMLGDMSWILYEVGRVRECVRIDSMAMVIADGAPSVSLILRGKTRQYLGFDHSALGDHSRAARYFLAAKDIYERSDSVLTKHLAESCNGVGSSYWHLGRTKEAAEYYARSLELLGEPTDPELIVRKASTLGNLGIMWQDAGDLVKSGSFYQQALALNNLQIAATDDPFVRDESILNRSRTYVNLASLYHAMGQYGTSRTFVDLALKDRNRVLEPDDPKLLSVQALYAELEIAAGNYAKAEVLETEYLKACERRYGPRTEYSARTLATLADLADRKGDHRRADSLFTLSIAIERSIADERTDPLLATLYLTRAVGSSARTDFAAATDDIKRARAILVNVHGEEHRKVAQCDILLARALLRSGEPMDAEPHVRNALKLLKDRRVPKDGVPVPRSFLMPHLLPDAILAEVVIERALDPSGVDREALLMELEDAIRSLDRNKSAMQDEESKLLMHGAHKGVFDLARTIAFEAYERTGDERWKEKLFELSERDRTILLKQRLNAFSSLSFAHVPDSVIEHEARALKQLTIDPDDEASAVDIGRHEQEYARFLTTLKADHPEYFALKYGDRAYGITEVREQLLAPGQSLVAYSFADSVLFVSIIEKDRTALIRLPAGDIPSAVRRLEKAIADMDRNAYVQVAHELYGLVFAPIEEHLTGTELLVIPDGDLYSVNLETLLSAPGTASDFKEHLLIQRFTISYLLSATTAIQFKQLHRTPGKGTLALAPGFSDGLKSQYRSSVKDSAALDMAFLRYIQQPFAERTVRELGSSLSAHTMLGAEADEHGFKSLAERFGIIHLGTHAEINNTSPLYSKLVLSKGGGEDGYLHAYEIYELQLRAELAVLTACETGSGRMYDSEGVRSLAHGFAYAGCPSLVMSLWKIDERSSAEIIDRFYKRLADGRARNHALREAKLAYLNSAVDEQTLPYYWAGLVLVGETSAMPEIGTSTHWWYWALGGALLVGAVLIFRRLRS